MEETASFNKTIMCEIDMLTLVFNKFLFSINVDKIRQILIYEVDAKRLFSIRII